MARILGWTAAGGLSIGIVFLSLAFATGGGDMRRIVDLGLSFGQSCDKGGANMSERHWKWSGGDAVDIALPATVRYRGGEGDEVIVRGSPDVIAHIEINGGNITLDCRGFGKSRDIEVILPGRAFSRVNLSGSGKVIMENLSQPDLALSISGNGDVRAQGKVDRATVSISGSGNARLADLAVLQLTIKVSGSGNIEASPRDLADIHVSGSGNVRLLTRPIQLRSHVSGSGRVSQASPESADRKVEGNSR